MTRLPIGLAAVLLLSANAAQAAPRTLGARRDHQHRLALGQTADPEDFVATLRESVDERLAVCAAGKDLRLDIKIDASTSASPAIRAPTPSMLWTPRSRFGSRATRASSI
jgi:hypothetical protein